ncbi:hypothetical protein [Nonomuraea sp. SYSU D8015]|uniref:hypothetical protein n=1 Tax=Nonomuraea sp. SYSU D8015 TaxID=2593644 RepID=UPI001660370F|nr:hypothetical protein [Nonomuraea sp. SYSU D8015]
MAPSSRNLLVWLHTVTSVGWMSQALALLALTAHSMLTGDRTGYEMAHLLDTHVLLHLANAAILTGIMLAAMTRWGFFRYWWVLTKFAITMTQLYAAIFLLSPSLTALAEGRRATDPALLAATALMASAIAFQAWLSVAKPWKRTPWAEARFDVPPPPGWATAVTVLALVLDYLLAEVVFGHAAPLFTALTAVGYPIWRGFRLAGRTSGRTAGR